MRRGPESPAAAGRRPAGGASAHPLTGTSAEYLQRLMHGDVGRARALIDAQLQAGASLQELYLHVFQPALYEIGRLWQQGEATIAQEHLATATTQSLMAGLGQRQSPAHGRQAIVTSTERDMHALGARFLADFLRAEGWTVLELGADTPAGELGQMVAELRPALVCLSTTLQQHLPRAAAAIQELTAVRQRPLVAVGGQAYRGDAELARRMGADLFAVDAAGLMRELELRLGGGEGS